MALPRRGRDQNERTCVRRACLLVGFGVLLAAAVGVSSAVGGSDRRTIKTIAPFSGELADSNLAVDAKGNLFLVVRGSLLELTPSGQITTLAGCGLCPSGGP